MEVMKMQAGGDGREIRGRQEEGMEGEAKPRATSQRAFHAARSQFAPRLTETGLLAHSTQVGFTLAVNLRSDPRVGLSVRQNMLTNANVMCA